MQFYDSDLQSKGIPSDMQSERDIPKEKLNKPKLLYKQELFRVHKEIRRTGISYEKPAYYDLVSYRQRELSEEQYFDKEFDHGNHIQNEDVIKRHIENINENNWMDKALGSMKKDEITIFIQEHLKLDQNGMKILDYKNYIMFQIVDWLTIVDLDQDRMYLKKIITKGRGGERCELNDEISYKIQIKQNENIIFDDEQEETKQFKIQSKVIYRILKSMKSHEICICNVNYAFYVTNENEEFIKQLQLQENIDLSIEIQLKQLYKLDDIYHDGAVLKKSIYRGQSTAKPDKISFASFNLWIYSDCVGALPHKEHLVWASCEEDPNYDMPAVHGKLGKELVTDEYEKRGSLHFHIDDLKISKLLRLCLMRMKKNELSIITCTQGKDLIKCGLDYDALKGKIPKKLFYVIHLFDFTEGKTNFNMTVDEKIEQAIRKRQIGLKWIAQQNFNKALKIYRAVNAYFDYGTFSEEDRIKMREYQISALLNTSLCQMKLQKWADMKVVCQKLYILEKENPKILYRYATALKQLHEYQEALEILKDSNAEEIQGIKQEIESLQDQYEKKQKKVYAKMFGQ